MTGKYDPGSPDTDDEINSDGEFEKKVYDLTFMVGSGSFLGPALLVQRDLIDPFSFIVDKNCGALVGLYAAHYGHNKFLRWLVDHYYANKGSGIDFTKMNDQFNCNIAHYAVRQGHLSTLIWIHKKVSIDFKI